MCRMSPFYGEDLAAVHAWGFTDLARAAAGELISRLAGPSRVVEFGCGDGTTARLLCEAGHQVHGFDVSAAMIRMAAQREPRARIRDWLIFRRGDPPVRGNHRDRRGIWLHRS